MYSTYIKIESAVDPSIIQMRHFLASPHYHRINKNVLAWIVHESFKSTRWSQNTELGKHSQLTAEFPTSQIRKSVQRYQTKTIEKSQFFPGHALVCVPYYDPNNGGGVCVVQRANFRPLQKLISNDYLAGHVSAKCKIEQNWFEIGSFIFSYVHGYVMSKYILLIKLKVTNIYLSYVCLFVCFIEKLNPLQSYHSVI